MIHVVDYGVGNLGSVCNMLGRIGVASQIARDAAGIESASKLILPGVGAFDKGMRSLNELGITGALIEAANRGVPILGICLGMQLLMERSEEGTEPGLALLAGRVRRFQLSSRILRIPHMGWNVVRSKETAHLRPVLRGAETTRFYFVHSYYVECEDVEDVSGVTVYGDEFTSMVERANIFGVQFHPEKSHVFGMALLESFAKL